MLACDMMNRCMALLFVCSVCIHLAPQGENILTESAQERFKQSVAQLLVVYARHLKEVTPRGLVWQDGTVMPLGTYHVERTERECIENPQLIDQIMQYAYQPGFSVVGDHVYPEHDPGRVRCEAFFKKMYGGSPAEVEQNLETIDWMPRVFGEGTYCLRVTRVNDVSQRMRCISEELEQLAREHPEYVRFLRNPGGTYCWRMIAGTDRLSNHSFGMTLDINATESQYWQWDLQQVGEKVSEAMQLTYRNTVPHEIVEIFEKYGFLWGGKWYHYDTMHFEYRPELFTHYEL